jgi:predicted nucleic acid-binding protein
MKLMLDTNIVVDVLSRREGYEESLQLVKYCELGKVEGFVSAVTVTDVMYILRKHIDPSLVRETVQTLLLIVDVANVLKSDITSAFSSEMKDYEDAVQSSCAERMKADYIVTRNINDFKKSVVPAILPSAALSIISFK